MELQLDRKTALLYRCIRCLQELSSTASLEIRNTGLFFQVVDSAHISMAQFIVRSTALSRFVCEERIQLYVPIKTLSTILSCMAHDDDLTLRATAPYDVLHLRNKGNASSVERSGKWSMRLSNSEEINMALPRAESEAEIIMSSDVLRSVVQSHSSAAATMSITVNGAEGWVDFSIAETLGGGASDHFGSHPIGTTRLSAKPGSPNAIVLRKVPKGLLRVVLGCQFLVVFTRANTVCDKVRVHLHPESPARFQYEMEDFGSLHFYLAPQEERART